jgi:hypothetical protein
MNWPRSWRCMFRSSMPRCPFLIRVPSFQGTIPPSNKHPLQQLQATQCPPAHFHRQGVMSDFGVLASSPPPYNHFSSLHVIPNCYQRRVQVYHPLLFRGRTLKALLWLCLWACYGLYSFSSLPFLRSMKPLSYTVHILHSVPSTTVLRWNIINYSRQLCIQPPVSGRVVCYF